MVSPVEIAGAGVVIFGVGVVLGMLLYRLFWHVDTVTLRREIEDLRETKRTEIEALQETNGVLREQIVQIGGELVKVRERLVEVEAAGRQYQAEFNALLRRG